MAQQQTLLLLLLALQSTGAEFSTPLCGLGCSSPDPWIQLVGNATHPTYYWLYTSKPLTMRSAATLAGLHTATPTTVWNGTSAKGYWAPELHYWPSPYSTWFIYVVYDGGRIQVLQSSR